MIFVLVVTILFLGTFHYISAESDDLRNISIDGTSSGTNPPNKNEIPWALYIAIGAVIVTLIGVILSDHNTRQSNKTANETLESFKTVSEADLLLKLKNAVFRSDESDSVIEFAKSKIEFEKNKSRGNPVEFGIFANKEQINPIRLKIYRLESEKSSDKTVHNISERNLENFLNHLETILVIIEEKTITSKMIEKEFGWVLSIISTNKKIKEFIEEKSNVYPKKYVWPELYKKINPSSNP